MRFLNYSSVGSTRFVVVVGPIALKIARGERGRRCNLYEANLYRTSSDRRRLMLCPVYGCSPNGFVLVMKALTSISEEDAHHLMDTDGFPDWDYMPGEDGDPFEPKASDWARMDGRLVALDYSTPAHSSEEEKEAAFRAAYSSWDDGVNNPEK